MNNSHESRRHILTILGLGIVLGFATPALAAPSVGGSSGPQEQACAGRSVGDACTLPNKQLGTCAAGTCNRLDYSGGSPPTATEEACVVCKPGGASPHDGGPMLGSGGPPPDEGGAGESAASASDEPPTSSSRCSVVTSQPAAPGVLGLALLALFGLRRSRRAR